MTDKHGPSTQAAGTLDQILVPTQGAGTHDNTHAHTPQLDRNTSLLQRSLDVSNPTPDDDNDATSNDDVDSQVLQHGDDEDDDGDDDAMDDLEPWVDWIKRCTHDVEARLKKLKLDDWTTMQKRRKWRWAGKLYSTMR